MRILICSDGTDPADKPILLGGLVAAPTKAETTLLGIVELSGDEQPLRAALESEAAKLRRFGVSPELVVRAGQPAAALGAAGTLLHVRAEPPAIYAHLVHLEEDVESLLRSGSELGRNLLAQKQSLEKLGVSVEVRVRHGLVLNQIFTEVSERGH